ncbi:gag/pol protein [Gossypium australe]|uniref:Gag/pol protein n=1 Tax=Gossypium australe TaxID=47621 RepID=A0A5B6UKJ9_9ROSI|nr:gag/pol protein [Gossypium australe]
MKDLGETNFILGIRILRNRNNKVILLSEASYIYKILERYAMTSLKKGNQPSILGFHLFLEDYPKTAEERENMRKVSFASVVGSLMYVMHTSRYLFCSGVDKSISTESRTKTLTNS